MRKLLALLFFTITLGMAQGANAGPYEVGMDWYELSPKVGDGLIFQAAAVAF